MADSLADSSPLKENILVNLPIERLQGLIDLLANFLANECIREHRESVESKLKLPAESTEPTGND